MALWAVKSDWSKEYIEAKSAEAAIVLYRKHVVGFRKAWLKKTGKTYFPGDGRTEPLSVSFVAKRVVRAH